MCIRFVYVRLKCGQCNARLFSNIQGMEAKRKADSAPLKDFALVGVLEEPACLRHLFSEMPRASFESFGLSFCIVLLKKLINQDKAKIMCKCAKRLSQQLFWSTFMRVCPRPPNSNNHPCL